MSWPNDIAGSTVQRAVNAQAHWAIEHSGTQAIAAWQRERLTELVQWLLNHVPWWRAHLGAQVRLDDWERLPTLSRYALRSMVAANGPAAVPPYHGELVPFHPAGPPGSLARFFTSAFSQTLVDHAFYADHRRQGRNPYASQACISDDIPAHNGTHLEVNPSLDNGTGVQILRALNQFTKLEHLRWLQDQKPAYLTTPPGWLEQALDLALAQGLSLPDVRQVMTYGAAVTISLRSKVRQQLGASVRHRYTSLECGPLAFQCPRSDDHLHVAVGNALLEVVDPSDTPAPEGTSGRVLVTALHQYATPLVRHDIGDTAALHSICPGCGLAVPSLSQLVQSA